MMRIIRSTFIAILVLIISVTSVALAATYEFKFPTIVTDNSGVTRNSLGVVLGYSGDSLVDSGKIATSGNDTNMQIGASSVKYTMAEGEVTTVASILPAGGKVTFDLYTGYSPEQTAFSIVPGYGGYIIFVDDDTLELGDNFTLEWSNCYVNTDNGTGKWLLHKPFAFGVQVTGDEEITFGLLEGGSNWLTPDSTYDASENWTNGDNAIDENTGTYAEDSTGVGDWSVFLEFPRTATWIDGVRAYTGYQSADHNTIDVDAYYEGAWNDVYNGAHTIGQWVSYNLTDPQLVTNVRIAIKNDDSAPGKALIYEVDYGGESFSATKVVATGVTTGEHDFLIESD